jgi:hypothetical protein
MAIGSAQSAFYFGRLNTETEVDRAIEIVPRVIAKLCKTATTQTKPEQKRPWFQGRSTAAEK